MGSVKMFFFYMFFTSSTDAGQWESAAYTLYIRTPRSMLCAVAGSLAAEDPSKTSERERGNLEQ